MAKFSGTQYSYTQSFLNQLQSEWKEFWFEADRCDSENADLPIENTKKADATATFKDLPEENIIIPVPLNALQKLFSPSKCHIDDVFKFEFFNEIKGNLNLTNITCKKLRTLIFGENESSFEYSDFPSPSIISHPRYSAPPRLRSKKILHKNELEKNELKGMNVLINHGSAPRITATKEISNDTGTTQKTLRNVFRTIIDGSDNSNLMIVSQNKNAIINPLAGNSKKKLFLKKQKRTLNSKNRKNDSSELRFSSVYDISSDICKDSGSIFIKGRSQRKVIKPSIVCTYFRQEELEKIYTIIKKLGFFEIENNVSSQTTHLICASSKKTMNLCKAVVRGCWILDKEWVLLSSKEGRWLYEERFEKSDLAPMVKENRLRRQKYGPVYRCNVFLHCNIHVSKSCGHPKTEDIKQLIILGGGHLTDSPEKAKYIIGSIPYYDCLRETWVLSCIMQGHVLNVSDNFKIK